MSLNSIISKTHTLPAGCLEVCSGIVKKAELGLSDNIVSQIGTLQKHLQLSHMQKLEKYQTDLDEKLGCLEAQFNERLAQTLEALTEANRSLFTEIETICADVCRGVLLQVGAEMSSQEKVNILISQAVNKSDGIDKCTVRVPAGYSLKSGMFGNTDNWNVKDDESLPDGEIVIELGFGTIKGEFDMCFNKHIQDLC